VEPKKFRSKLGIDIGFQWKYKKKKKEGINVRRQAAATLLIGN